jgi:hypothetical protein
MWFIFILMQWKGLNANVYDVAMHFILMQWTGLNANVYHVAIHFILMQCTELNANVCSGKYKKSIGSKLLYT